MAAPRDGGVPQRRAGDTPAPQAPAGTSAALRVPFVRRCELVREDATRVESFIVNISVLGAYVASGDELEAPVGALVSCRFQLPGNEQQLVVRAMVVWVNRRQDHPVHSLPPGVGLRFVRLAEADRVRIAALVEEYVKRNPRAR